MFASKGWGALRRISTPVARAIQPVKRFTTTTTHVTKTGLGMSAGFGGVLGLLQAYPFAAQVSIATVKTSIADLLVQKQVEKKDSIDWHRNLAFILFGGAYLGIFQWVVYVRGFQRLFPEMNKFCSQSLGDKLRNKAGLKSLFGQIALDFVFIQPFLYFPVFYGFKTFVDEEDKGGSRWMNAFQNWKNNFFVDNLGMCGFWLPMDLIIYSVPVYLRLPINHAISFIWCCVLSIFRGDDEE
uniref:Uncharacterized protein n=1 Tax=Mucochytrium quahogii TaxID=96639 RepID=A0A7S2WFS8_9STRA|mmetsp:Transcript_16399/g.28439  ORF Transcript_16399/g.28439 Transcript_16399/m.28439 type:complete len:240 (+) Transcript_16399:1479-2198(+)